MKKKKEILLIVAIIILIVLCIPRKSMLWDGGSVEYKAVLYKYTKVHRLANNSGYFKGVEIEFLGFKIFDNTKIVNEEHNPGNTTVDCCHGCICGNTIELLKNTETAWTLTKVDSSGEYVYSKHSFINFHGTGKNRFAFFKNDELTGTNSEVKGEFNITRNEEIILTPDNKEKEITCKLGEEKDLIAIMHCDNDFGTFTIQKEGKLELPNIIKDTITKTKKVVITGNKNKTITDEKDINEIIKIIKNSKWWTGPTTSPSIMYDIKLFDSSNNDIAKIEYTPGHYFFITINNKSYSLTNIDKEALNKVLEK